VPAIVGGGARNEHRKEKTMGIVWGILIVVAAAVVLVTVADILRRHLGAAPTSAWILVTLLLPLVGSALYWAMRPPSTNDVRRQIDAEQDLRRPR
jgi:hypothetical protein